MNAPWPEGVIARYLTVGGATVDLTHQFNALTPPTVYATFATCTGCNADDQTSHYRRVWHGGYVDGEFAEEHDADAADQAARDWSQAHAEKCRAMPKQEA